MTNLSKVTLALLGFAVAGTASISASHADTVLMKREIVTSPAVIVPEQDVMFAPVIIPQVRTQAAVIEQRTTALSEPYTVETRYGNTRLFEQPILIAPETHVELLP
jgi:hypothetical protein